MGSKLIVLMVGLGGIGQRHVRNLYHLLEDSVDIWAVRTRRLQHVLTDQLTLDPVADLEERYRIRVFTDLQEALNERPDVVIVTNPSSLHVPVALPAAQAGCHLFIEKPLSHSYNGVPELIGTIESKGLVCLVGYQLRFHPCVKKVKSLLADGTIGKLLAVRLEVGEYLPGWHKYEDYRQMYASRRDLGGGVILSQIHEFDLAFDWFGLPKRVFAVGGHLSKLEIDVEDVASILFEYALAGRVLPVHMQLDYVQRPPSRTYQFVGERGKIYVDLHRLSVLVVNAETGDEEVFSFDSLLRNQLFLDEMSHFLACVRGQETPVVDLRTGAESLRMALAARESLEREEVVRL